MKSCLSNIFHVVENYCRALVVCHGRGVGRNESYQLADAFSLLVFLLAKVGIKVAKINF